MNVGIAEGVESRIAGWRDYISKGADTHGAEQLEYRLREQVEALLAAGLDVDEAFLVALKRVGVDDARSREFAASYSAGLWSETVAEKSGVAAAGEGAGRGFAVMLACAVLAAVAIKIPWLLGYRFAGGGEELYVLNLSFFVLPFLAAYFAWVKRPLRRQLITVAGVFAATAVAVNVYPFVNAGSTQVLTAIHLPVLLWLVVGVTGVGGEWLSTVRRMEYTRFTGEWFITYVLIALGGGVLSALTIGVFEAIGLKAEIFVSEWLIPCGAMGAVLVGAWLVESRRNLVGGLAPMLAKVFTPLFSALLLALLVGVIATKGFISFERDALILFDVLLAVVLALLLYNISARDPQEAPGLLDRMQLVLVAAALGVDLFVLANIAVRVGQFGFSANRLAVLGLNLILLVNLAWSAYLQFGFVRSKRAFADVERWQMRYLPVYAIWAAVVALGFPLIFGFK